MDPYLISYARINSKCSYWTKDLSVTTEIIKALEEITEELFYNLRVGKIYNKNSEAVKKKNDKFDYKKKENQRFYVAKPNMNKDNKLGKNVRNMFPHITKEGSIP